MSKDIETIEGLEKDNLPLGPDPCLRREKKSVGSIIWKWFRRTVLTIFILVVGTLVTLQLPVVQTWIAHQLSSYLKNRYDLIVKIDRVNINLFRKTVSLQEVLVGDHHNDTIIHAGIIKLNIGNIYPGKRYIDVKKIVVENGYVNIRTYKGEKTPNITQFINKLKGKKKKKKGKIWVINMNTVVLDECNLRVRNENQKKLNSDFLPSDIRVHGIGGKVGNFQVRGDTLEMDVENIRAFESSGLAMKKFSSHVLISSKELTFKDFRISTYKSSVAGYFSMKYTNWKSFSHFNDSVFIIADLEMSDINAADLSYFTNNLKGINFDFRFKGGIAGTLSNLKSDAFSIYFGSISQMVGEIELRGLPNVNSTYFAFKVKKLTTDALDLEKIPLPPFYNNNYIKVPKEIDRLGVIKYQGNLIGSFSDMQIDGFATTKIGNADLDVHLFKSFENSEFNYIGEVNAQQINIGILSGVKQFGTITFDGHIDGRGFNLNKGEINFKGLVRQLEFNGYNYKNIKTDFSFGNSMFEGIVDIEDPNAMISFIGTVDLKNKNKPVYDFTAEIGRTDLVALNLIKSPQGSVLSTALTVKIEGKTIDDLVGQIRICGTDYTQGGKTYHIETFVLNSFIKDTTKTIDIHSDIVNAKFSGQFKFIPLINEIKRQINHVAPSVGIKSDNMIQYTPQNFYFYVVLSHPELLTQIFIPSLSVSDGTIVEGRLGSKDNYLSVEINSNKIKYKNFALKEWYFYARNKGEKLRIQSDASAFYISDSTKIDNLNIAATAINDSLDVWFGFQNEVANLNGASINILTCFGNAPTYEFKFHDSYFYFNDTLWVLNDDNNLVLHKTSLSVNNLTAKTVGSKNPILSINGKCSESDQDKITASLNNFPLEIFNVFIPIDKIKLQGNIVGDIELYKLLQKPYFTTSMGINDLKLNNNLLGDLGLYSTYDPMNDYLTIQSKLIYEGKKIISIENGEIKLNTKGDAFNIKADIDGLDLSVLEKLANPVFTNLKGKAYGSFLMGGSFKDPTFISNLNLQQAGVRLAYLNAYFNFEMRNKIITIKNDSIIIPKFDLTDKYGNTGTLKGTITHTMFKNIFLDVRMATKNMCILETTQKNNDQFYGKAFVTGKATVLGPIEDILVFASMTTEKNTVLNIPIKSSKSIKQNNFVIFTSLKDTTEVQTKKVEDKGNFTLDLDVKATPDATIRIIFDETVGDVITCQGKSDKINLKLDTKGAFSMLGNYEITKGDYLFTLQNIINKKFTVKSGSSISFTGNPYLAQVNATAIYRANTSVYPIVSSFMDPTNAELYRKSTRVDCELTLTNTLAELLLEFNFQLPSLDATAASIVKSALNTQEEMNRQVFSLLLLNQFIPLESTHGGTGPNISSGFGSTSLGFLSGQLNNWLSKLTQDVSINVDYKSADKNKVVQQNILSSDQISVALSTQLFDNRLVIDGDVGVNVTSTKTSQTNQIVGNVSVEIKVTNDGRLRVRAFNRPNDWNPIKNSVDYTQGVGISYKVEFDNWGELFKSKKPKKEKNEKKNNVENSDTLKTTN